MRAENLVQVMRQAIFVDRAVGAGLFSDAVMVAVDWLSTRREGTAWPGPVASGWQRGLTDVRG
jgi:hypothetical protein